METFNVEAVGHFKSGGTIFAPQRRHNRNPIRRVPDVDKIAAVEVRRLNHGNIQR